MILGKLLETSTPLLEKADISTARLDVLVLVADELKKDKSWVLAHPEYELTATQLKNIQNKVNQRVEHEPLAYIRGKTEFYGRTFVVNGHTLEPRPESETMVELALKVVKSKKLKVESIIDVGTGSGAIGITLKLEMPKLTVLGTDISEECIRVAKENASTLKTDISFLKGNLLEPVLNSEWRIVNGEYIVLTNLPYVPEHYRLNKAAEFEPRIAIFGGTDGLDLYRQMFDQIMRTNLKPAYIFTESLPFQHEALATIAKTANYQLEQTEDFIQVFTEGSY